MIYCENVVKILWTWHLFFFFSSIDFKTFPPLPPIFGNVIATITIFFLFPYFGNGIATISLSIFFFFFLFTSSTPRMDSRTEQRKSGITVAEIQHFLSPPFSSSLSYFWLNFGNDNTEIQSLSSKSQITLNSSYNAN